jgi:dinuclear metal center YbgI/SA1388 family protein
VPRVRDLVDHLQTFAPLALAETWDNVGLLLGDPDQPAAKVLTCLTVTPAVVAEAVEQRVGLIVSHHPILFKSTQRITTETPEGRMLWDLSRAGVAVYSPHTAYDNCRGGINDQLAESIGLQDIRPLVRRTGPNQVKIVVFVPEPDLAAVSQALFDAGAGVIGQYRECSFRLAGTGTFFGGDSTNPTVGQRGRREEAPEYRLEVICSQDLVGRAVAAMRKAHSYEEPAFDLYPLQSLPADAGAGRLGVLPTPLSPSDLARCVAKVLGVPSLVLTGARDRAAVRTLAIVCGAGGSLLGDALHASADAFLTGELRFHDELAAQHAGLAALVAGHYLTERPGVEHLATLLTKAFPDADVWASHAEKNPATLVR